MKKKKNASTVHMYKKNKKNKRNKKEEEKINKLGDKKKKEKGHAPELALPALAADGINLVDEDDARSVLPGLLEEVTHSPGTDPDEHLDKVGTWQHMHRYIQYTRYEIGLHE